MEEPCAPTQHAQVDLGGAAARANDKGETDEKLPKRPAFATGEINLSVPPLARILQVTATPRDKALEPGGETTVNVEVRDAAGRPVEGSELAVVVVDESVLALSNYKLEDPVAVFYAQREAGVGDYHLRKDVQLANPGNITTGQGGGAGGGGVASNEVLRVESGMFETRRIAGLSQAAPSPSARRARGISVVTKSGSNEKSDEEGGEPEAIRKAENFHAVAGLAP